MSRVHTQGSESINEEDEKLKTQYMNYLRKGIQLHEDSVQLLAKKVCEKAYLSIDDETKVSKIREIRKSMIIGTDPTGGYFTIPDISSTRVTRNFETSPVRRVATIMSTLKKSMEFIIDDNEAASGGWVSEIQTRPTTATPDIGQLDIFTHEQFSQPLVTQDALDDDSFDIGTWLENKVQDIITRTENTAFVIGDGAGKPRGFLDYPAWTVNGTYQRGAVEQINSGINGDFTADSFVDLQNGLQEFYQSNAVWMIKRATFGNVMKLKDGQGQYLINPRILAEGAQMILLGNPVIFADDMPTIATDSLSVV